MEEIKSVFGVGLPKPAHGVAVVYCDKHGRSGVSLFYHGGKREYLPRPCPACKADEDAAKAAEVEAESARVKAEEFARKVVEMMGRAGIPRRFEGRTLENFKALNDGAEKALRTAKLYAEKFDSSIIKRGTCLTMLGNVGTGKTHLAIGIAHKVLEQGHFPLFVSAIEMVRFIKESWSKNSDYSESEAIRRFVKPSLLIIDEVGVQFGSHTEKMFFFEIMNKRYEDCKPSILLTNLSKADFVGFIGDRVDDRLSENNGCDIVFDWPSYRASATM